MAGPGVKFYATPSDSHKVGFAEEGSRILAEEALSSNGFQVSITNDDTPSLHSLHSNDLPSITTITNPQSDDNRIGSEEDVSASEFELSDESDSGVHDPPHDRGDTVAATQNSPISTARIQVDEYSVGEAEVRKKCQIEDGPQHCAFGSQNVVTTPEQHTSLKAGHGIVASQTTPSSNDLSVDEKYYLEVVTRKLEKQRANESPFVGGHKTATKTKPAEGGKKLDLPIANHGSRISQLAEQNRDKHDPDLRGLDFIGGNGSWSDMIKQLAFVKDGDWNKGSESFVATRGEHARERGGSPLQDGRGDGKIGSSSSRSGLGLSRRLSFDATENIPLTAPLADPKLGEALTLVRSIQCNSITGKNCQPVPSAIHSSIDRRLDTTRATLPVIQMKTPSPKSAMRSRETSFIKDTSACLILKNSVVKTTFNNDWPSIAFSALAVTSFSRPPSPSSRTSSSAPRTRDAAHQTSAESAVRDSSDGADYLVQSPYNSPLLSFQSAQDWGDEHSPDNIYDAPQPPPAQLISLSPVRSAASGEAFLDLRELQDEHNLDWMSMPVLQPGLSSEAATTYQPAADVTTLYNGDDSSLLMDFESPSRVADQSSAPQLYRRQSCIPGSTMALSLMDQCSATDEELFASRGLKEVVENTVALAAVVLADGRIRYSRDELISMRHTTPPDPIVDTVDSFRTVVCRCRRRCIIPSSVEKLDPLPSRIEAAIASAVEVVPEVRKTTRIGGLGDSKWASPEGTSLTTPETPLLPLRFEGTTISDAEVFPTRNKSFNLGGLGKSKWASSEKATSAAPKPPVRKTAGAGAEDGSALVEILKAKKFGVLADSKYASPKKKPPETAISVSSHDAGQSTPVRPRAPPRQSSASGGSNGGILESGRSGVLDENISPFPSRTKIRGGFAMDGDDDISSSPHRRRCSLSISTCKSQSCSEKNTDDEVKGAAGEPFVVVNPSHTPLAEKINLHHHRAGAVRVPVEEFGRMRFGAATAPLLPPVPTSVPTMPAAFVPNSSQPLLLQGHAFITGGRGEVRRVRCGVRGSPWHDRATNTVMANIIVGDRIGRETEMVGALHGLPYDLQGNRWHADLFQAVEDLENEEEAVPIGPPRVDSGEYLSQPDAAVYSWQSGLEESSLPRFVPGPSDNFGSPPMPIHPSVVPPPYPGAPLNVPQTYIYPVPPPAASNLVHFHPVVDRSHAVNAPRDAFPGLANNLSDATLITSAFPSASAERRYTFGIRLMPNIQNHPGYQNPQVQTQDGPNQQLFNHYVAQAQQPTPPERVHHYFTEFQTPKVQTQAHPNQDLFNHYIAQAQQPSAAQRSLQRIEQLLGPPVQFSPRRPNVPDARSPNLPDGPPAPGTIFGNVPNSVTGRPDLAPEDAFDYQPPTPGDLAHRSHFEGFDGVFHRVPRANAAIPIVDPNALSASRPAIRGILKKSLDGDEAKRGTEHEEEAKRG